MMRVLFDTQRDTRARAPTKIIYGNDRNGNGNGQWQWQWPWQWQFTMPRVAGETKIGLLNVLSVYVILGTSPGLQVPSRK